MGRLAEQSHARLRQPKGAWIHTQRKGIDQPARMTAIAARMKEHFRRQAELDACGIGPRRGFTFTAVGRLQLRSKPIRKRSTRQFGRHREMPGFVQQIARPAQSASVDHQSAGRNPKPRKEGIERNHTVLHRNADFPQKGDDLLNERRRVLQSSSVQSGFYGL